MGLKSSAVVNTRAKGRNRQPETGAAASPGPEIQQFARTPRIPKTAEVIATQIRGMIIRGELNESDSLPNEAKLIEQFSASRACLREAIRILENEKFISIVRGSKHGARIHLPNAEGISRYAGFAMQAQGTRLADVYRARLAIEPYAARCLAEAKRPASVEQLKALYQELVNYLEDYRPVKFAETSTRFHLAVVELCGSNTLTLIARMLQDIIERHQARVGAPYHMTAKTAKPVLRSFEKLIAFVEQGKAVEAEQHWRLHVTASNKVWTSVEGEKALVDLLE
jgi:DNA-binding FadR family transcriptional regulator